MSRTNRPPTKDMYWFAHGGTESEKAPAQVDEDMHGSGSPTWNVLTERKGSPEDQKSPFTAKDYSHIDGGSNSSGPSSLEKDDRLQKFDKRTAVEERKKQLWEAEQERNDAVLKKHMEREAALEARRNAQRSNIAFAFGSSVPRNVDSLHANDGGDSDVMSRSCTASGFLQKGDDVMSKSMTASMLSAPRGRRKNDLMPTVPYERIATPRATTTSSTRKRSVSMTRLDQLALPRRHYVEANKASSAASSGASSVAKDNIRSPSRPLSSASENSGGSGRVASSVTRRMRSSPRKPRPISIAGTIPDQNNRPFEVKVSPIKKSYTPKKNADNKAVPSTVKSSTPKSSEKAKTTPRPSTAPKLNLPKTATPKTATPKTSKVESKPSTSKQPVTSKAATPKVKEKKSQPIKKKADLVVASPVSEVKNKPDETETQNEALVSADSDAASESEKNNAKRIISEEEAKAALAEKRRLAREQAEREAELERQRQEELRLAEMEQQRKEEEEHRQMEEEQIRLLEEHRRQEEEKFRKAIEDQEQKEEEERAKRDEDLRMKAEQEKKAKEEAEKQRLELEEKLRKEEEERAERKKRLDKIMSRTRGKSSGTSPSGSVSGSDQLDSGDNPQEGFSSGANSLESNGELSNDQVSVDGHLTKAEISSAGDSMEANPTYEIGSENESLNSNDLMMPLSETASQENSLDIVPEKSDTPLEISARADLISSAASSIEDQKVEMPPVAAHFESEDTTHIETSSNVKISVDVESVELSTLNENGASENVIDVTANVQAELPNEIESNIAAESNSADRVENLQHLEKEGDIFDQHVSATVAYEASDSVSQLQQETDMLHEDSIDLQKLPDADISNQELPDVGTHCSISSDMKLPDPIYETSDEGSVSSEKHHGQTEEFSYSANQDIVPAPDDVFSEQVSHSNEQDSNPFGVNMFENQNPFASNSRYAFQSSEMDIDGGNEANLNGIQSTYLEVESNIPQASSIADEDVVSSRSSPSSVIEADFGGSEFSKPNHDIASQGLKADEESSNPHLSGPTEQTNQFSDEIRSAYDIYSNPEVLVAEKHDSEGQMDFGSMGDNLFAKNGLSNESELNPFGSQGGDFNVFQQQSFSETEQFGHLENQTANKHDFSNHQSVDEVTFIKADDSGACIGIISSIDHDQVANEFPKATVHSEQFKSNFECASVTDSEDNSSLDSNSSQIRTVEKNTIGGLNHVENSVLQFDLSRSMYSNGDQHGSAETDIYNHDSISKSFNVSEVITNGHSLDTSKQVPEQVHEYGHLDGNDILSVDHSQNNIFENVNALEYGSSDPFLAKGNSKQISGNPFLLQDDQKQVLMTSDFLN